MAKSKGAAGKSAVSKPAKRVAAPPVEAATYTHPEADAALRPDVGTQAQFRKKKEPVKYRYDSSLSPVMEWDGQNPAREQGETLIARLAELSAELGALIGDFRSEHAAHPHPGPLPAGEGERDGGTRGGVSKAEDGRRKAEETNCAKRIGAVRAEIAAAGKQLQAISRPFLNWAGKAERLSFDVPTLPLFVHERLSTAAIIETLQGHKKDQQMMLFADPQRSIMDQVLKAYEHRDKWVNRMILGDSLAVMNSLLHYESMGGQVQMIYMDPPYGVKFGSNFQPFVRKRDVSHNDDEDMTREPEMVKAYRDTWELGLHSYLTYMRDRLLLSRELLAPTGSIFVQISDENVHHVRELMDEVFGAHNFCAIIAFETTTGLGGKLLAAACDYILWYAKDRERIKHRTQYVPRPPIEDPRERYICVETPEGTIVDLTYAQKTGLEPIPDGRILKLDNLTSQDPIESLRYEFEYGGRRFIPSARRHWSTHKEGMLRLAAAGRLHVQGDTLWYKRYRSDFPFRPVTDVWDDVKSNAFGDPRFYVVQTASAAIERCLLMTTDPGDLVLDPTCGSGTTAYVAEQWGRRWITADVSRVPLALARQRLLTSTFPWYELRDDSRGPVSGFAFRRRQNQKGDEVGGIVPRTMLYNIANGETPAEVILTNRPEELTKITRVCGPFCVEATIPAAMTESDLKSEIGDPNEDNGGSFADRMVEILRKSPVLRLEGNKTITLRNVRVPAKTLALSAEAGVEGHIPGAPISLDDAVQVSKQQSGQSLAFAGKPVAFVFGPENGAVSEKLVYEAAREAHAKSYAHLFVIGFAVQPNALSLVQNCEAVVGIPATYVQATPDLLMGDLLKNMRSSQIFSVCGMPEIKVEKVAGKKGEPEKWRVKLLGVDVFDPIAMESRGRGGNDVPAWFLDTDYNGLCFHVCQAFFPRTGAWENLKKSLRGTYEESVWDHLAGDTSAPFESGEHKTVAVKVIDDRGNELMVVKGVGKE